MLAIVIALAIAAIARCATGSGTPRGFELEYTSPLGNGSLRFHSAPDNAALLAILARADDYAGAPLVFGPAASAHFVDSTHATAEEALAALGTCYDPLNGSPDLQADGSLIGAHGLAVTLVNDASRIMITHAPMQWLSPDVYVVAGQIHGLSMNAIDDFRQLRSLFTTHATVTAIHPFY